MKNLNKLFLSIFFIGILFNGCGSDRANSAKQSVLGVSEVANDSDKDGLSDADELIYGTDANNSDTDGDGLKDGEEIKLYDTNATNPDTDNDGLKDGEEIKTYDTNATNPDTDEDGLKDGEEIKTYDTNATNPDTDEDGLKDAEEINTYDTNATNPDTDNDGLKDGEEIKTHETNATNSDTDGDCLLDSFEVLNYGTNPKDKDTDKDNVNDGVEVYTYGLLLDTECMASPETLIGGRNLNPAIDNIPSDGSDVINALDGTNFVDTDNDGLLDIMEAHYGTDINNSDTDYDGLKDGEEVNTHDTNATNPDTDGDGLNDGLEINTHDTNATNPDTDNDGLNDGDEINTYNTSPKNPDTDADGLKDNDELNTHSTDPTKKDTDDDGLDDGEEIITYGTEPTNPDTDSDGLKDGLEINTYETNATNKDTDGDCLLDGFEVLNYETNATNVDTDGDKVNDGIEIYSDVFSVINTSCIDEPETLSDGVNIHPAKDNKVYNVNDKKLHDDTNGIDVIDALDPHNDSDGDGDTNTNEGNCTAGDPLDDKKACLSIVDRRIGLTLAAQGFAYIPGGFDVDGDGVNEAGFWISRMQARTTDFPIDSEDVIATVGANINKYISKHFKVVNKNVQVLNYSTVRLKESGVVGGDQLQFNIEKIEDKDRISSYSPYLAEVCLSKYVFTDKEERVLDIKVNIPTHKQYMQVKQLLDADAVNEGDGRHIRSGLLGEDPNLPDAKYSLVVDEFGEIYKEFVRNLIQLRDPHLAQSIENDTFKPEDVQKWWGVTNLTGDETGSYAIQDLGYGIGTGKDVYATIVRGGGIMDLSVSVAGASTDAENTTNGISFRASTLYLDDPEF